MAATENRDGHQLPRVAPARTPRREMAATENRGGHFAAGLRQEVERQPSELAVDLNRPSSLPPSRVAPAMIAIAISATSRPYSTAEAPRSVRAMAVRRMRT